MVLLIQLRWFLQEFSSSIWCFLHTNVHQCTMWHCTQVCEGIYYYFFFWWIALFGFLAWIPFISFLWILINFIFCVFFLNVFTLTFFNLDCIFLSPLFSILCLLLPVDVFLAFYVLLFLSRLLPYISFIFSVNSYRFPLSGLFLCVTSILDLNILSHCFFFLLDYLLLIYFLHFTFLGVSLPYIPFKLAGVYNCIIFYLQL